MSKMLDVNGNTKIYVLLGNPIAQTLSPAMYNAAFRALQENRLYIACKVEEDGLEEAVKGLKALGIMGGNVTVPFKEKIIPFLDGISEESRLIGAVNTLYCREGELWGTNTDGAGFLKALKKVDPRGVEGRRVLMLGAGGSARAVAVTLAMAGAKEINIINRTLSKAQEIMEIVYGLDCRGQALGWDDKSIKEAVQGSDFIINTTSLGMVPRVEEMPPLNPEWIRSSQWVIDLIYKPKETLFLREARTKGCQTLNGLGMLLEQGVLAFEQWSGLKPPVEVMARELERWV